MELSRLAGINKRIKDWIEYSENSVEDTALRKQINQEAQTLMQFIAKLWNAGVITPQDQQKLLDSERKLESLHEEARLTVVPRTPPSQKVC